MIINPYVFGVSYDPDAQAFITAANITNTTQKNAINQLVLDLKSYSIWTKFKAIYPIVGGTAASHKWNLKDPRDLDAAFRLTFSSGWTHTSSGMTPTNAYADTKLNVNSVLQLNSIHLSYYSRTNVTATQIEMGISDGSNGQAYVIFNYGSQRYVALNRTGQLANLLPNTLGHLIEKRIDANNQQSIRNGSLFQNVGFPTVYKGNLNIYLGAHNSSGTAAAFSSKQCSFSSIGDGLTDTEAANFNIAVQAYQTTLGRQV